MDSTLRVETRFLAAFNILMGGRDELLANCRIAQEVLCDCSAIKAELAELHREMALLQKDVPIYYWQADYNFAAAFGKIMQFCGATVRLDNLADDGEAQAVVLQAGSIPGLIWVFEDCLRKAFSIVDKS